MPKVGIITQARMTSTRLPGKILLFSGGKIVLHHHIHRLQWSGLPVFVATTNNQSDKPVVDFCTANNFSYFRGDEFNVLERFTFCARMHELDTIIRVTSDCPLIDGNIIAEGLDKYQQLRNDKIYYSNCIQRTYPRGLDFEIFSRQLLEDAYENATLEADKEHVTPYINQNRSGSVVLEHHTSQPDYSDLRWTLDTPDDWTLLDSLLQKYNAGNLRYEDIIAILIKNPTLKALNTHVKQKEVNL
ncbi:MAG: glycosyltransferase family protein [Cyclobacteriaceae bacterium]|nr:glycosyltransferase family protein [Cyclobacteriaceae bacterium]